MGFGGWWMALLPVLFLGMVMVGGIFLIRRLWGGPSVPDGSGSSALRILGALRQSELAVAEGRVEVVGATKSNGIVYSMPFWDDVFTEVAAGYPSVKSRLVLVDALAAFFVTRPHTLDVVVASNLFGDILTDIGGAIMGSIGVAPAANLNPEGEHPSMFEPVHGSAPDIAGRGIANPIGQMWTAKLLLDDLDLSEVADLVLEAIEDSLAAGIKTPDLGGRATTTEVGDAVVDRILTSDRLRR